MVYHSTSKHDKHIIKNTLVHGQVFKCHTDRLVEFVSCYSDTKHQTFSQETAMKQIAQKVDTSNTKHAPLQVGNIIGEISLNDRGYFMLILKMMN